MPATKVAMHGAESYTDSLGNYFVKTQEIDPATGLTPAATTVKPQSGALTNRSGTISAGGVAQNAAAALTGRVYLFLLNPLTETEILWFSTTATAVAASPSIPLYPGQSFEFNGTFCPSGAVSVIAATTGHVFIGREG